METSERQKSKDVSRKAAKPRKGKEEDEIPLFFFPLQRGTKRDLKKDWLFR
jgi:hypothetical protein